MKLAEAIPNISEGVHPEVVKSAVAAVESGSKAISLLDLHSDADHNRSVLTLVGNLAILSNKMIRLGEVCIESIDLNVHRGVHPRMGALDVVPLVPLGDVSLAEVVECARELGARFWDELDLPVYLYGDAALRVGDSRLPAVRVPFEALEEHMLRCPPDFGSARPHPTAGAVAVGARSAMVAFNVWIDTKGEQDARLASEIASEVREKNGGLPGVRALGLYLPSRGLAQVSMNLTEPERAGVGEAYEAVRRGAVRRGADVLGGELVGLAPAVALTGCSSEILEACNIDNHQVLENRIG